MARKPSRLGLRNLKKSQRRDLHSQHPVYKTGALLIELRRHLKKPGDGVGVTSPGRISPDLHERGYLLLPPSPALPLTFFTVLDASSGPFFTALSLLSDTGSPSFRGPGVR